MKKREQMQHLSDDLLGIEMAIRDLHAFLTTVWTHQCEMIKNKEDKKSEE